MEVAVKNWLRPGVVLCTVFVIGLAGMGSLVFDYDEGAYLSAAREVAHGKRVYGDVMYAHPPLLIGLDAFLFETGLDYTGIRSFHWALSLVPAGFACAAVRAAGGTPASALLSLCLCCGTLLGFRYGRIVSLEPLAAALATPALFLFLFGHSRGKRCLAGALLALACLTKLSAATALVALAAAGFFRGQPARQSVRALLHMASGFLIVALPAFIACLFVSGFAGDVLLYQVTRERFGLPARIALFDIPFLTSWFDIAFLAAAAAVSVFSLACARPIVRSLAVFTLIDLGLTFFAPATFYAHYLVFCLPGCAMILGLVRPEIADHILRTKSGRLIVVLTLAAWSARLVVETVPARNDGELLQVLRSSTKPLFTTAPLFNIMSDRPLPDWYYAADPFAAYTLGRPSSEYRAAIDASDEVLLVKRKIGINPSAAMLPRAVLRHIQENYVPLFESENYLLLKRSSGQPY